MGSKRRFFVYVIACKLCPVTEWCLFMQSDDAAEHGSVPGSDFLLSVGKIMQCKGRSEAVKTTNSSGLKFAHHP